MPIKLVILVIVILGIITFAYQAMLEKSKNATHLHENGTKTNATITNKTVESQDYRPSRHRHKTTYKNSSHHYLHISFTTDAGDVITGPLWVTQDTYENAGESITIYYDANDVSNMIAEADIAILKK